MVVVYVIGDINIADRFYNNYIRTKNSVGLTRGKQAPNPSHYAKGRMNVHWFWIPMKIYNRVFLNFRFYAKRYENVDDSMAKYNICLHNLIKQFKGSWGREHVTY